MDYTEDILYYARDPRFRGLLENPSAIAHRENPSCGDALTCSIELGEGVGEGEYGGVKRVCFEGVGCVICLASATVLAEHIEGLSVDAALAIDRANMVEWLGCDVGPMRTNCMMLALLTLRDALKH